MITKTAMILKFVMVANALAFSEELEHIASKQGGYLSTLCIANYPYNK